MPTKTSKAVFYVRRSGKSGFEGGVENPYGHEIVNFQNDNSRVTGDNLPGWRQKISSRASATTPLSGVSFQSNAPQCHDGFGAVRLLNTTNGSVFYGRINGCIHHYDMLTVSDPSANFMASVKNKVIQDINSQIRTAHKSLQGLVSLGEMGESVRMVNSLGRGIYEATTAHLRDLAKVAGGLRPQDVLRTVSEKWLEYRFGIRPLVSDISGFIDDCYQNL